MALPRGHGAEPQLGFGAEAPGAAADGRGKGASVASAGCHRGSLREGGDGVGDGGGGGGDGGLGGGGLGTEPAQDKCTKARHGDVH